MKVIRLSEPEHFAFWCPGCLEYHHFDKRWTFNGDMNKPTLNPSLLVKMMPKVGLEIHVLPDGSFKGICHSFVKDGNIQFLDDCTHGLAGQTVEIPEIE